MNDPTSPPTHMGWAQFRHRGKFVRWYQIGPARFERDEKGRITGCAWEQALTRGTSGHIWYLPIGETPPNPSPEAKRPDRLHDSEEDF
jgi:hypothetical protein